MPDTDNLHRSARFMRLPRWMVVVLSCFVLAAVVAAGIIRAVAPAQQAHVQTKTGQLAAAESDTEGQVLGDATEEQFLQFNVPTSIRQLLSVAELEVDGQSIFGGPLVARDDVSFEQDVEVAGNLIVTQSIQASNATIDLGTGSIFAGNIIYSVTAGDGVSVTGDQELTIANTDKGSDQEIFKNFKVAGKTISAGDNDDTLTFSAGDNVSLSSSGKTITISSTGASSTTYTAGDGLLLSDTEFSLKPAVTTVTSLTMPAGGFIDLSAITHNSSSVQGLKLPQNTAANLTAMTSAGEGFIAWATDENRVKQFDGTSWANLATAGGGGSTEWTDAGGYLYPDEADFLGNSSAAGGNKLAGIYLADAAPLTFGTSNDIVIAYDETTDDRLEIGDGTNTFLSLADAGSTGTLTYAGTMDITPPAGLRQILFTLSGSENSGERNGAVHFDNTDNDSHALTIYSNHADNANGSLMRITAANSSFDKPALWLINEGTAGTASGLRIDGPRPEIEFWETDQTSPAGAFELRVNSDKFQIGTRNSGDSGFDYPFTFYRAADGGNMGIGTTAPAALLAVGSSSQFKVTSSGAIASATGVTSSGSITFSGLSTDGLVTVSSGVLSSTATLGASYITADALDFSEFKDALTLDASTDIAITGTNVFSLTNTGTGYSFRVNDQSADASPFVISASGAVGIGTTDPTAGSSGTKLAVYDAEYARVYLRATDPASDVIAFLDARGDGTNTVQFGSASSHPISFYTSNNRRMLLDTTGGLRLGAVNDLGSASGNLHIEDSTASIVLDSISGNPSSRLSIQFHEGTPTMSFSYDGSGSGDDNKIFIRDEFADTDLITFTRGGNIGIGSTTPAYELDVNGDIQIAAGSDIYSGGTAILGNRTYTEDNYVTDGQTLTASIDALDQQMVSISGSALTYSLTAGYIPYADTTSSLTDTALYFDGTNIGIGTTNPSAFLVQVTGNIGPNSNGGSALGSAAANWSSVYANNFQLNRAAQNFSSTADMITSLSTGGIDLLARGDLKVYVDTNSNGSNAFSVIGNGAATEVFRVEDSGSVSIGTTAPTNKLHLYSENSENVLVLAQTTEAGYTTGYKLKGGTGVEWSMITQENYASNALLFGADSSYLLALGTDGNVGIGTTQPGSKLDITGNARILSGGDLSIGSIGLNDTGSSNTTSGSALIGVYSSELAYSSASTLQDVLDDLDSQIGSLGSGTTGVWTRVSGVLHPTTDSDALALAGTDSSAGFYFAPATNSITLNPYGTSSGNTGEVRFSELVANGSHYTGFKSPNSLAGSVMYTLPVADATTANQVLASNSSGVLSWIDVSAGSAAVAGEGTVNYLSKWSSTYGLEDSLLFDDGTNVGIGTTEPAFKFDLVGSLRIAGGGDLYIGSIGLGTTGAGASTSGASVLGVYDEFTNSDSANVQDVLDDLDAAIASLGNPGSYDRTVSADGSGTDTTIADAITNSSSGDIIFIKAGTYNENITITKPLTLLGASKAAVTIAGSTGSSTITIADNVDDVTIARVSVSNAGTATTDTVIEASGTLTQDNITIYETAISGGYRGIYLRSSDNTVIARNTITGTAEQGVRTYQATDVIVAENTVSSVGGAGIEMGVNSFRSRVVSNSVTSSGDQGIYIYGAISSTVTGNIISSSGGSGISSQQSDHSTITGNSIQSAGETGIRSSTTDYLMIQGNTINNPTSDGISLGSSSYNSVVGNSIYSAGADGIEASHQLNSDTTISSNTIIGSSGYGIDINGLVDPVRMSITNNIFRSNSSGTIDDSGAGNNNVFADNSTPGDTFITRYEYFPATSTTYSSDLAQFVMDGTDAESFTGNALKVIVDQSQVTGNILLAQDDGASTLFQIDKTGGMYAAGNVGVGSTNPGYKLDVNGVINAASGFRTNSETVTDFTGSGLALNAGALQIASDGIDFTHLADSMTLDANQSVSQAGYTWTQSYTGTTANAFSYTADSLTSAAAFDISLDGLTSGKGMNIESTSTALTSGSLMNMYWNPGSATIATGDLFKIDLGSNATLTGNVLALYNNGSPLFKVSTTKITSSVPHEFTAAGDVSFAYDAVFTNQTASVISSYGPLTISSGEPFENLDLTLRAYGTGAVVIDNASLNLYTGEKLIFDTNDSADSYLAHNNGGNYSSIFTDGTEVVRFMADGSVDGNTTFDTNQFDVAEYYPTTDESVEAGDVVALAGVSEEDGATYKVAKADLAQYTAVLGVVSTKPGFSMGGGSFRTEFCSAITAGGEREQTATEELVRSHLLTVATAELGESGTTSTDSAELASAEAQQAAIQSRVDELWEAYTAGDQSVLPDTDLTSIADKITSCTSVKQVPVALAGRVPVKIDYSAGPIKAGDLLTASPTEPGKAVKATRAGFVIGRALESASEGDATVMTYVFISWYDPGQEGQVALSGGGSVVSADELSGMLSGESVVLGGELLASQVTAVDALAVGTIKIEAETNSITALSGTLQLQNAHNAGNIEAFKGKLVMTTDGGIVSDATVRAQTVTAKNFAVLGASTQADASIGAATLAAGKKSVTIQSTGMQTSSKVLLTPTSSTQGQDLIVSKKSNGSFVVTIDASVSDDIQFDYWVVGVVE